MGEGFHKGRRKALIDSIGKVEWGKLPCRLRLINFRGESKKGQLSHH